MWSNLLTGPPVGSLGSCSVALAQLKCIIRLMMCVAALCSIMVGVLSTGAFKTFCRLMADGVKRPAQMKSLHPAIVKGVRPVVVKGGCPVLVKGGHPPFTFAKWLSQTSFDSRLNMTDL